MEKERDETLQERKGAKRTHQNTYLAEDSKPWANLPHEIITEILSRLPVKTLLQFRCVCKSWCSLISNPQFVKTHLNLSTNEQEYAHYRIILSSVRPHFNLKSCSLYSSLYEPSVDAVELDYPMKNPHNSVWIVGSCNGLICIAIEEDDIFIWNPSTRKSKRLPNSGMRMRYGCFMIYGFGYDDSTDDYKVLGIFCVVGNVGSYETEVKIYTLRTDSWRRIQDFPCGIPLDDSGKYANGALHWAASCEMGSNYSWVIVSFDLAKETYGEVAQPNYGGSVSDFTLGILGGCLCVVCTYIGTHADVWVMKEYTVKDSWTKLVTIPYLTGLPQYPMPLCISKNDEILTEFGSSLVIYNPKNNIFRYPLIHNFQAYLEVDTYVESLVSPIADNGG
uniref:Putative F-box associated interaction domain-containing protein n=1 Tax=Davidia involucrata TaxID=16924 RepID=A0A5B7BIV1_DAVIN